MNIINIGQDIIVGWGVSYVSRLHPDGSQVWSYVDIGDVVNALLIDSNNNIVVGSIQMGDQVILDSSGNLVTIYSSGANSVNCLAMQSDGKILVGHTAGITRLNIDYTIDNTFDNSYFGDAYSSITSLLVFTEDNNIGDKNEFLAVSYDILLFSKDGGEPIFNYEDVGFPINTIALQSDGKVLGGTENGVFRFLSDGSVDGSWGQYVFDIFSIIIKNDEVWVTGDYFDSGIWILNISDGTFKKGYADNIIPFILINQINNKVLVGTNGIYRWNPDFSIDNTFSSTITSEVHAIALIN